MNVETPNEIANEIMSIKEGEEKYDYALKQLLSNKEFLARILKRFVKEFAPYSLHEIETEYLEHKEPLISKVGVEKNTTNQIEGLNVEDKSNNEGNISYDILFKVRYPDNKGKYIGTYIDLEIQEDRYPGYKLETRAVYYAARRLGSELEKIDKHTNYDKLQKVYSIFLVMGDKVPVAERGTATLYEMRKTDIIGSVEVPEEWYDLISVIMIRIHDEMKSTDETLNILQTICSGLLSKQEKLDTLKRQGVKVTDSIEKEVTDMSALRNTLENEYSARWIAEGEAKGRAEAKIEFERVKESEQTKHANSIVQFVQNIMKNANCSSIDEACKLMGCSLQEYYAAKAFLAKK